MKPKSEEYKNFLIELYKGNQEFIDKAIFTFASVAIPMLITFSEKLNLFYSKTFYLFFISLISFILVVALQIIASLFAKQGCDLNLGNEEEKNKANTYFDIADKIDSTVIIMFILAIIITFGTVFTDISHKREEHMNNKLPKQGEILHNSLKPPKAIRQDTPANPQKPVNVDSQHNVTQKIEGKQK